MLLGQTLSSAVPCVSLQLGSVIMIAEKAACPVFWSRGGLYSFLLALVLHPYNVC